MNFQAGESITKPQTIYLAEKNEIVPDAFMQICRDQIDLKYQHSVLPVFFFRNSTPRLLDLMRIVAVVAHADRRLTRQAASNWGRLIQLCVPVDDPDFWSSTVSSSLCALLGALSGDKWTFTFRKSLDCFTYEKQQALEFPAEGELAIAYSNGLDSFALARLVASGAITTKRNETRCKRNIVLITTGRRLNAELKSSISEFGHQTRQVSVPLSLAQRGPGFRFRETSYRTRSFVFQTMAAIAAYQSQSNTVVITESGQGSIGPWMTVTGQEAPDIRSHPLFTKMLSKTLELVFEKRIEFVHPQLWKTKGETIKTLVANGLSKGWERTISCAVRQSSKEHNQCGICANCLLRRQSLQAAQLLEADETLKYKFDLTSGQFSDQLIEPPMRKLLALGVMPLVELARLSNVTAGQKISGEKIKDLAESISADDAETSKNVRQLLATHRSEFISFIEKQPKQSLIRMLGEAFI